MIAQQRYLTLCTEYDCAEGNWTTAHEWLGLCSRPYEALALRSPRAAWLDREARLDSTLFYCHTCTNVSNYFFCDFSLKLKHPAGRGIFWQEPRAPECLNAVPTHTVRMSIHVPVNVTSHSWWQIRNLPDPVSYTTKLGGESAQTCNFSHFRYFCSIFIWN